MNTALLVTGAICVGVPALTAAALLAWQRHPVIDAPDPEQPREFTVPDAEDHDLEPSPGEQAILDQIRAAALPDECVWRAACGTCGEDTYYQDCPTGGWWIHDRHPVDSHEAVPRAETTQKMRDRTIERHAEQFPADAAYRGIVTAVPAPPAAPANAEELLAEIRRVWGLPDHDTRPRDDSTLLTADELAADVAAYEAAAAERFRHAGVTWPTNPATVGIARYGDKAGKH